MSGRDLVRTAVAGALAGLAGTVAMDARWYRRYRASGGESGPLQWEFGAQPTTWDEAAAPAKVGKLLLETITGREVPIEQAGTITNVMHWGYGKLWGVNYALVAGRTGAPRPVAAGLAFGTLVWASDYVLLPALGIYKPIWQYDRATLRDDLAAHLVYGVGTAAAFRVLAAGDPGR
jgi:hypothetical protein